MYTRKEAVEEKMFMFARIKTAFVSIGMIAVIFGFLCCSKENIHQGEKGMPPATIQEVLNANTDKLMSIPGVVGAAIGEQKGELCIKVLVIKKTPELAQKIPSTLEDFPVVIQETSEIRKLDKS